MTADDDSAAATCDDAALKTALSSLATRPVRFSCGHAVFAGTADDTVRAGVSFQVPGTVVETVGMSWALPNEVAGVFEVQTGTDLTVYDCEDAVEPNLFPVVVQQWDPISGTATMTVG